MINTAAVVTTTAVYLAPVAEMQQRSAPVPD